MFTKNALITVSVTLAVLGAGCVKQEVSFTKEVRPILQKNCISCHAPGVRVTPPAASAPRRTRA